MSAPRRPLSRRVQALAMKVANLPMRRILGLPFPTPLGRRLMLIFYTGRRSGKAYRQPVSFVRDDGVLLTPGGGRWTLNLHEGEPVRLRLAGHDVFARPELVKDPEEVERLLGVMAEKNPMVKRFVRIPNDSYGHLDRASLDATLRHGFRIVRWRLPAA